MFPGKREQHEHYRKCMESAEGVVVRRSLTWTHDSHYSGHGGEVLFDLKIGWDLIWAVADVLPQNIEPQNIVSQRRWWCPAPQQNNIVRVRVTGRVAWQKLWSKMFWGKMFWGTMICDRTTGIENITIILSFAYKKGITISTWVTTCTTRSVTKKKWSR